MRPPNEFVGVALPIESPYELRTDDGVPVRLHDMSFLGFDNRVDPPTLTLRFVYDDPEWTPQEAVATPVAVYRFDGVQAWQREDDDDLFQVPVHVRGQVDDLAYYEPTNVFALVTLHSRLMFSADRLTVSMQQRTGDQVREPGRAAVDAPTAPPARAARRSASPAAPRGTC